MKKILNQLLEIFLWFYELFLCSLALPLLLGISVVFLTPLAHWLLDHIAVYLIASVIIGFYIKQWNNKRKNKN